MARTGWSFPESNVFWIVILILVSGPSLVRLVVATIDDPSLLWTALLVILATVAGMWLIGFAMSEPDRQRRRFLTKLDPEAIHVHATHAGRSIDTLSRLGLANTEVRVKRFAPASLQFTDDSLDIWTGGRSPHLVARLPRANFIGLTHTKKIVTGINRAVSVSLEYLGAAGSTEFVFVPSRDMGRPLRSRQVDELLPSIQAWVDDTQVAP